MTEFAARPVLADAERKIVQLVIVQLATYRKDVDAAINLSTIDPATGIAAMQTADARIREMLEEFKELAAPRPAARRKAAPAPIRVKSDQPWLTSGFGALGPSLKASGNGEWKEF